MTGKDYFDRVAGQWDTLRQSFFSDAVRERALQVGRVEAGQTAADIGAGSGFLTEALLAAGLRVIAVDQSEAMLAVLRAKFAANEGLEVRVGEAESLPIDDGAVDRAFANMFLHHVERPEAAVREMARLLKPGGRLVITDLDEHDFTFLRTEHHDLWLGFRRDAVMAWLTGSGLHDCAVECLGEECCAESTGSDETARVSIFVASGDKPRGEAV